MGILLPMVGSEAIVETPSLFGKTRQTLLALLYSRADEEHLQESLIQLAGLGRGAVQRELEFLAGAGVSIRHGTSFRVVVVGDTKTYLPNLFALAPLAYLLWPAKRRIANSNAAVVLGVADPDGQELP